jgi:hypothetical protein
MKAIALFRVTITEPTPGFIRLATTQFADETRVIRHTATMCNAEGIATLPIGGLVEMLQREIVDQYERENPPPPRETSAQALYRERAEQIAREEKGQ